MTGNGSNLAQRIVVGTDGSDGGRHALAWAVAEAAYRQATLEVVHVWTAPVAIAHMGAMVLPEDNAVFEKTAEDLVAGLLEEVRPEIDAAGVAVETRVVQGHPPTVLLDRLDRAADLLIVGSRGHGTLSGLLLGSISHQVVHHATKPVAVIPQTSPLPADGDVVVGVDGSEPSWVAARWAVDEAGRRAARLVVLHGWWTPVAVPPVGIAIAPTDREEFEADTKQMLHDMVDGIVEQAAVKPAAVDLVAAEEPPARVLIERSHGAGMVVVGSRGRGGFAGLLLGSVSQQVIHHAACAVVVVR
jgi:nucleotide-binding universal stress UspA family protein